MGLIFTYYVKIDAGRSVGQLHVSREDDRVAHLAQFHVIREKEEGGPGAGAMGRRGEDGDSHPQFGAGGGV